MDNRPMATKRTSGIARIRAHNNLRLSRAKSCKLNPRLLLIPPAPNQASPLTIQNKHGLNCREFPNNPEPRANQIEFLLHAFPERKGLNRTGAKVPREVKPVR